MTGKEAFKDFRTGISIGILDFLWVYSEIKKMYKCIFQEITFLGCVTIISLTGYKFRTERAQVISEKGTYENFLYF